MFYKRTGEDFKGVLLYFMVDKSWTDDGFVKGAENFARDKKKK